MKILLIGGGGFIGSHLTERLINRGHQVCIIDPFLYLIENTMYSKMSTPKERNAIKQYRQDLLLGAKICETYFEDDGQEIIEIFQPDVIFHMAALPLEKEFASETSAMQIDEIAMTYKAICWAKLYNAKRFLYMSSLFAYGDFEGSTDENRALNPKTVYGIAKATGEFMIRAHLDNWNIIRTTSVYGFGDVNNRATQILFNKALRGEEAWVNKDALLDFIYIYDLVAGLLAVIEGEHPNEVFHISGGNALTLFDYATELQKHFPHFSYAVKDLQDRPKRGTLENKKALEMLNWKPAFTLAEGIDNYLMKVKKYGFA